MSDKIKCYKFTPGGYFDNLIVEANDNNWDDCIRMAETLLDGQYSDDGWEDIELTIKCVYLTREELDELDID